MSYSWILAALATLSACAEAGVGLTATDARQGSDARDAPISIDAPPSIDAPNCTPIMTELLVNPAFDASPLATGWTETVIDAAYPLITGASGGVAAMTAPNRAWLGGFAKAAPNTDVLRQDVMVPAGTTSLTLTGSYDLRTGELLPIPYDTAKVQLVQTNDSVIEDVLALDNSEATTAWTAFSKTFSSPHAGQTVRLRLTSTGDGSNATSFFFDSLSLIATHPAQGCP